MKTQNKTTTLLIGALLLLASFQTGFSQEKTDSMIVNVGKSKIIFLIRDHDDLKSMQDYDLNKILDQLSIKLTGDSSLVRQNGTEVGDTTVEVGNNEEVVKEDENNDDEAEEYEDKSDRKKKRFKYGTRHAFNFDLGINNYVDENGKFPDETNELYTVKPIGSWYVGISSVYKTRIVGPLYVEWGGGVSWYNFKFENTAARVIDGTNEVIFVESPPLQDASFDKSKLTVAYLHASFVPMFDFGRPSRRDGTFWREWWDNDHNTRGLRFGLGAYYSYKIDSYTKVVTDNGDREKTRDHEDYHLENFRYGARLQIGYRGTDLFFNYDISELFKENEGPRLNAFSFGIIL